MSFKYAYYTGCAAKGVCPELHQSTLAVARALGIELVELKSASCCGAGVIGELEYETQLAMNARNLALAERMGTDMLTVCGTCQGVLSRANHDLKGDDLRGRINEVISDSGGPYGGTIQPKHLLWVLIQDYGIKRLEERIKNPLTGLRVGPFYGCYILRPSEYLGFDDPYNPKSLEQVIRALGAQPVDYSGRTKCCGFPIVLEQESSAMRMVGTNLLEAMDKGADCLVTPCPLCHMNLDIYQGRAEKEMDRKIGLPILHLPQLVGLALGIEPRELGLEKNMVDTGRLLELASRGGVRV
ncbi:MAG: CoB--CoM heterodisulfide reductase iron-sulfur subunit B family protein [Nitrospirota bacterium]|nr:CoB--CoM heterodisulfide reductase iron-sulfur subunit B family protein [Nitrospirota bacterium]